MSEETPNYEANEARDWIILRLWPRGTEREGQVTDLEDEHYCYAAVVLQLFPADAELLAAEYERTPGLYEQAAAHSIRTALHEREERIAEEEPLYAED